MRAVRRRPARTLALALASALTVATAACGTPGSGLDAGVRPLAAGTTSMSDVRTDAPDLTVTVPALTAAPTTEPDGTEVSSDPVPDPVPEPVPETPEPTPQPAPEPPPAAPTPTPAADVQVAPAAGPQAGTLPCPGVRCLTVAATGDVLLHPQLVEQARRNADGTGADMDFFPMLAAQQPWIAGADLAVCHLETPLAPSGGPFSGYPAFSVPPQVLPALLETGYDACTTASNHTLDQGTEGVQRTLDALDAAGLAHDGSYRTEADSRTPLVLNTAGGRVGLISASYGWNGFRPDEPWRATGIDVERLLEKARAAKAAGADVVVVALHAGEEYDSTPTAEQRNVAARLLADPAVDLIVGHHAHVVQPIERIGDKWAIHGLGNTVAAQFDEVHGTRNGLLVRVQFSQDAEGRWTAGDLGWVASYQDLRSPFRWCPLTAPGGCPDDPDGLARVTDVVNALGADRAGAHPIG
ncbi:CapA family protein [Nakamurella leprariae]|uniref:CapA family protein n=1 Tax=Nakamurella leprariae TaxID=2803911 RepID=A0A938Y9X4_9ACTN|nr:CapA family protein [Nakamurella leprariae]MBM9466652.1 CapA family protein [Nakamurella leprariae]